MFILFLLLIVSCYESQAIPTTTTPEANSDPGVCQTEKCKKTASIISSRIDFTVNPCEDFYKYACGKQNSTVDYPSIQKLYEQNLKNFESYLSTEESEYFSQCTNKTIRDAEGVKRLQKKLDKLFLPAVPNIFLGNKVHRNAMDVIARVKTILGINPFFTSAAVPHPQDDSDFITVLTSIQNTLSRPDAKSDIAKLLKGEVLLALKNITNLHEKEFKDMAKMKYRELLRDRNSKKIAAVVKFLSGKFNLSIIEDKVFEISKNISDFLDVLYEHAENNPLKLEDLDSSYIMTSTQLQNVTEQYVSSKGKIPQILWFYMLERSYKNITNLEFEVCVPSLDFAKEISLDLAKENNGLIEAALWWTALENLIPEYAPTDLMKEYYDTGDFERIEADFPKYCTEAFSKKEELSRMRSLLDENLDNKTAVRSDLQEIVNRIKQVYIQSINDSTWLDDATKKAMFLKIDKMTMEFGIKIPVEAVDSSSDETAGNFSGIIFETGYQNGWHPISTYNVGPGYYIFQNIIKVPVISAQPPIYDFGLQSLNYGAMGNAIGHEITHGFGPIGQKINIDGKPEGSWNNAMKETYEKKIKCFSDQYANLTMDFHSTKIIPDDKRDEEENIADIGLIYGYNAYKLWEQEHGLEPKLPGLENLTPEQLYFLGWTQVSCEQLDDVKLILQMAFDNHASFEVRTYAPLRNFESFSEAWNCPVGSLMNPENKCKLW